MGESFNISAGEALKSICNKLRNTNWANSIEPCKTYGCLECKNFIRKEGYDQHRGCFAFFCSECKKQPDKNMNDFYNTYTILDIEPDYNPNFHYDAAKGECPYFEQGENELLFMTTEEKQYCIQHK
jgi:hypothetical protein